jgi:hypothetical protein
LLGWLIRHYWQVGVERALRDQKLILHHSQQRAAGDIRVQREVLRLLVRGEVERAVERLASGIAIFYHSWRAQPDLVKDAEPIKQELVEIERAIDSIPSLRTAIQREDSDDHKSA